MMQDMINVKQLAVFVWACKSQAGYFCISPQKGTFQGYPIEEDDPERDNNSFTIASLSMGWNDLVNS